MTKYISIFHASNNPTKSTDDRILPISLRTSCTKIGKVKCNYLNNEITVEILLSTPISKTISINDNLPTINLAKLYSEFYTFVETEIFIFSSTLKKCEILNTMGKVTGQGSFIYGSSSLVELIHFIKSPMNNGIFEISKYPYNILCPYYHVGMLTTNFHFRPKKRKNEN
ncbi:hypothetical protein [Carp edema virus]|nr:hypothetical protein [Carp edema virus]